MKLACDLSVTSARHHAPAPSWRAPWASPLSGTAPGLVLDFAADAYGTGNSAGSFASVVSFTRASDATRTDPAGALQVVGPDVARFDHDPVGLGRQGLLLEGARTNLFVQSAAPADQTITVNAVTHVLSFYGTGTVTLSGVHSATVSGAGTYPVRTELTFVPTAGDLTVSLAGQVQFPQLEEGDASSSHVPTGAAATARAEDVATVPLGSWFDPGQGTLVFSGWLIGAAANDRIIEIDSGVTSDRLSILWNSSLGKPQFQVWESGAVQAAVAPGGASVGFGAPFRVAVGYAANDFAISLNGSDAVTDSTGLLPSGLTTLRLGRSVWGAQGLMLAESVVCYPVRLSDAELKALSA